LICHCDGRDILCSVLIGYNWTMWKISNCMLVAPFFIQSVTKVAATDLYIKFGSSKKAIPQYH